MEHNVCTGISDVRYFSPRLLAALTGILSSPLTVIEAPMGYARPWPCASFCAGKTWP